MTTSMFGLIMCCVLAEVGHELCFKHAANHGHCILASLKRPILWLGIFLWAVEIIAWIMVLEHVPLTIAFPLMSLVYVATIGGGALVLKEKVTTRHIAGALLITAGVALIGTVGK